MKKLFLIVLIVTFSSCAPLKLVGNYPIPNHFAESALSFDEVWSKVIDYFAITGTPITTIEKQSGIIVSSKMSFVNNYTREDKKGNLINPEGYVVIPTVRGRFGNILEPSSLITGNWTMVGDWNVRVKSEGEKTIINVNLTNVQCFYTAPGAYGRSQTSRIPIKSTGRFESNLLELFR